MRLNNEVNQFGAISSPDIRFFAHELKHMYQFETTNLSIPVYSGKGPHTLAPMTIGFLYSKQDEREAYDRQGFFCDTESKLPGKYNSLPATDPNAANYILYKSIIEKALKNKDTKIKAQILSSYNTIIQGEATCYNAAIRINNITYVP